MRLITIYSDASPSPDRIHVSEKSELRSMPKFLLLCSSSRILTCFSFLQVAADFPSLLLSFSLIILFNTPIIPAVHLYSLASRSACHRFVLSLAVFKTISLFFQYLHFSLQQGNHLYFATSVLAVFPT
jgi:hypothetical protein